MLHPHSHVGPHLDRFPPRRHSAFHRPSSARDILRFGITQVPHMLADLARERYDLITASIHCPTVPLSNYTIKDVERPTPVEAKATFVSALVDICETVVRGNR